MWVTASGSFPWTSSIRINAGHWMRKLFKSWIGPFNQQESADNVQEQVSARGNESDFASTSNNAASPSENAPAENSSQDPQTREDAKVKCVSTGCLDLRINDSHGQPITGLEIKVLQEKVAVFTGKTGNDGSVPTITGLKIGGQFEVRVKKDSGDYKFAAIGTIASEENFGCMESPKTRFEFSTEPHPGASGTAEQRKDKVIKSHNQRPAARPEITGNPDRKPQVQMDRDINGHPKASVVDGLRNWYNRNADNAGAPVGSIADLERVERLIEFAKKQAEWQYEKKTTSGEYIKKMHDKTFVEPPSKAGAMSATMCNKYVKIALWYAYHEGDEIAPIGAGVDPARDMGPALLKAGFVDVTSQLPDGRWAAPGDIIVYQKKLDPRASGHIDIRTYDGYISDFFSERLPANRYRVTGIYRRSHDPMPEKRMRAFLKILREWECHQETDDGKRYFLLQQKINNSDRFTNTESHPCNGISKERTFAGAYQIALGTWKDANIRGGTPLDFSPLTQDRIAVWKCEDRAALSCIRLGKIEKAVDLLRKEWTSLPGGKDVRRGKNADSKYIWSLDDLMQAYERNLKEL